MAAGDTMQGKRHADVSDSHKAHESLEPGGYRRSDGEWECVTPNGLRGRLTNHDVTEHEGGTITVSPSILVEWPNASGKGKSWHGYLERGVWREV
jgi:hypothetical protein